MTDPESEDAGPSRADLPSLASAAHDIASDALSLAGFAVPSQTASRLLSGFRGRKIEEARTVLLEQLRKGEVSDYQAAIKDDQIAIIYRYYLAAAQGRARRNLHLLAQAIVGLAKRDSLFADDFNAYAKSLEDLTRDEILVLGRFYALLTEERERGTNAQEQRARAWDNLLAELVPDDFQSQRHISAICGSLTRSGLIIAGSGYGAIAYSLSPQMEGLAELIDFEEALAEVRGRGEG